MSNATTAAELAAAIKKANAKRGHGEYDAVRFTAGSAGAKRGATLARNKAAAIVELAKKLAQAQGIATRDGEIEAAMVRVTQCTRLNMCLGHKAPSNRDNTKLQRAARKAAARNNRAWVKFLATIGA